MESTKLVDINKVKGNEKNPRTISDHNFNQLVKSIKEFPEMLKLRPIVVNKQMTVLGGNMRLKACKEAGLKQVWILRADKLTKKQQDEFIIKDNIGSGKWDWSILVNKWNTPNLKEWGLPNWVDEDINLDEFFKDDDSNKEEMNKIILQYNSKDFKKVVNSLELKKGTKEEVIFNLLEL